MASRRSAPLSTDCNQTSCDNRQGGLTKVEHVDDGDEEVAHLVARGERPVAGVEDSRAVGGQYSTVQYSTVQYSIVQYSTG